MEREARPSGHDATASPTASSSAGQALPSPHGAGRDADEAEEELNRLRFEHQRVAEELEAYHEELRVANEELARVNSRLREKVEELQAANSDLACLLASTDIAVLFLDTGFRIRWFTPAVRDLMGLIPGDIGRPLAAMARRFDDPHLDDDARAVLERLATIECEVDCANGRHYLRRITPYRTTKDRVEGVVITFVDISARRRAEAILRGSEERLRLALDVGEMAAWDWDIRGGVIVWNDRHFPMLGYEVGQVEPSYEAWAERIHPEDRPGTEAALVASREARTPYRHDFRSLLPDGSTRWLSALGHHFYDERGVAVRMVGVMRDVTERKRMEDELRSSRDDLETRVAVRTEELTKANEARAALLRRLVTAQEDERRRVSRELHDGLGQELTGLGLLLKSAEAAFPEGDPGRDLLLKAAAAVVRISRESHNLAIELRPTALDDIGLIPALSTYVRQWSELSGVLAGFRSQGLSEARLPSALESTIYRLVQEALHNVAKHAGCDRVDVVMMRRGGVLTVVIDDDGRGFDPESIVGNYDRRNLGLLGMRERIGLVGGTLTVESGEGKGTFVRAIIPLHEHGEGPAPPPEFRP
ncbi:PAS domain-containing protein [Singulisphaera sp. PoT]|uniref:PAS domain-containing protein n=1 Tax=Singulisphaera sp. PoT TaxID=3411797 RepID=UPI003BF58198